MSVSSMLRAPVFAHARARARRVAEKVDRPLLGAFNAARALRAGRGHVLYFGDSSLIHISGGDTDRRRLGEMVRDYSGVDLVQFYGPGFPPAVYSEFARLIADLPRPKLALVSMPIRTTHAHVAEHPVFGYRPAVAAMRRVDHIGPRLLVDLRRPTPAPEEYRRFEDTKRVSRWGGTRTIGEYRRLLKGFHSGRASIEQLELIHDYFHGEYSAGVPGLADWQRLGVNLRRLGIPVLYYRTYMPVESGTRYLGEDFEGHVEENFRLVASSLEAGVGDAGTLVHVDPPPDELFIDALDGTEHYNEAGRAVLSRTLAAAIRECLA